MSTSDDASPPLPRGRRRSSLLTRKSIVPVAAPAQNYEVVLKRYINDAKSECKEWKNVILDRRTQAKTALAVLKEIQEDRPNIPFETLRNDLSEEDLRFLDMQPNYEKVLSGIDNIVEDVEKLRNRMEQLNSRINLNHLLAKSRLNNLSEAICLYSDEASLWMPQADL